MKNTSLPDRRKKCTDHLTLRAHLDYFEQEKIVRKICDLVWLCALSELESNRRFPFFVYLVQAFFSFLSTVFRLFLCFNYPIKQYTLIQFLFHICLASLESEKSVCACAHNRVSVHVTTVWPLSEHLTCSCGDGSYIHHIDFFYATHFFSILAI